MERIPQPIMDKRGEPHMQRFQEQRWLLDNTIRSNGIDWDQPRSIYISAPCGPEGTADIVGVRERVKKMGDIAPAFEAVARRREAKAKGAEEAGNEVTARDNYFMAAVYWGAAQWPYDQNDEPNVACHLKKRECYTKYAAMADHKVEAAWIPFKDTALPAWFHLPPNYKGGKIPVVINVPGMDSYKEIQTCAVRRPLPQPRLRDAQHRRAGPVRSRRCSASISAWRTGSRPAKRCATGSPSGPRST